MTSRMRGDIEIMLGLQTVMKMMIEEIQADNKEKEEDLLARLTGLLVKAHHWKACRHRSYSTKQATPLT